MENLEKIYTDKFEIYSILNSLAISGNKPKKDNFYIDIIGNDFSYSEEKAQSIFKEIESFFVKEIYYDCEIDNETETLKTSFLESYCEICNKKIKEHEYYILYRFNRAKELSEFNVGLLNKFFLPASIKVIDELKDNLNNVIPFVGSGVSKELGFPLWLEMLWLAKEQIPEKHHPIFDLYYEKGNIDDLIKIIKDTTVSLNTDRKIKQKLVLPQFKNKLSKENYEKSIAHHILMLERPYVITTNYDQALEIINAEFELGYEESKNLSDFSGFEVLEDSKFIFHIHGDITNLDTMIVTNTDYEEMYKNNNNEKIITGLIMRNSLLFMGFSLNDKYFSKEFTKICKANKNYVTNYMICLEGEPLDGIIKENIDYITMLTTSIGKDKYDTTEQYRFILEYIKGQLYLINDK